MQRNFPWIPLAAIALAGVLLSLYSVWPTLFPAVVAVAPLVPDCDLREADCTAVLPGGGKVRFAIDPRSIPVLKPLDLTVHVDGIQTRRVSVDFAGTDMNMGYNRVALESRGTGQWKGQASLPVCVRSRMTWEARVLLETDIGIMAAPFRFDTFTPTASEWTP